MGVGVGVAKAGNNHPASGCRESLLDFTTPATPAAVRARLTSTTSGALVSVLVSGMPSWNWKKRPGPLPFIAI